MQSMRYRVPPTQKDEPSARHHTPANDPPGHALTPLLIVQQNSVNPSLHNESGGQSPGREIGVPGLNGEHANATSADPMVAKPIRKLRRVVRTPERTSLAFPTSWSVKRSIVSRLPTRRTRAAARSISRTPGRRRERPGRETGSHTRVDRRRSMQGPEGAQPPPRAP